MSSEPDVARPSALWRDLAEDRRLEAALAFWEDEQSVAEQAEVVGLIARQINFRPKSVLALPAEKKSRYLVRMARLSDQVAARLLVAYHLATKRPMMCAFLDALGIAHEDGLIADADGQVKVPEAAKVVAATRQMAETWPAEDLRLYFSTLLVQDPEAWAALRDAIETVPRGR